MVNLKGKGALEGVNLAVDVYDSSVYADDKGEVRKHYLDVSVHKDDERFTGQTVPNLRFSKKAGQDGKPDQFETKVGYTPGQLTAIEEAAGDNKTALLDKDGKQVGTTYGIKANLFVKEDHLMVNTKTVGPSELSVVTEPGGPTYREQVFQAVKINRDAKKEAAAAGATATVEAEAAPAVQREEEPALG